MFRRFLNQMYDVSSKCFRRFLNQMYDVSSKCLEGS